jgi:hypothetical protein
VPDDLGELAFESGSDVRVKLLASAAEQGHVSTNSGRKVMMSKTGIFAT